MVGFVFFFFLLKPDCLSRWLIFIGRAVEILRAACPRNPVVSHVRKVA